MDSETRKLLIVDDDAELLELTAEACAVLGYPAWTARSVAEALDILRKHPGVTGLMTDVRLDGAHDGFRLAAEARGIAPDLPVLFVSGFGDHVDRPASFADAKVVAKPIGIDTLRRELSATFPHGD